MNQTFDVIVLGLGAMGSSALWQLAEAGVRVLGIDQFSTPHTFGSSHGHTRIIREAYFEDPAYVPLVQRAYELWADLEGDASEKLFEPTGGLMVGTPDSIVFGGSKRSAEEHRLPHEILSAAEIRSRFPAFRPAEDMMGVWEPRAGFLYPEACIRASLRRAICAGAEVRVGEKVSKWSSNSRGVTVSTPAGQFEAGKLIISAGSWLPKLLPELAKFFRVERQVLFWFQAAQKPEIFQVGRCPVHLWQYGGNHFFYGFPDVGQGVKIARHHDGEDADPDQVNRVVSRAETEQMRNLLKQFLPLANGTFLNAVVCLYTNTPDGHFLIDHAPDRPNVILASPCSGHGFKFASAVGEVLMELALKGNSARLPNLFRLRISERGSRAASS